MKRALSLMLLLYASACSGCCLDLFKLHLPDAGQFSLPDGGLDDLLWESFWPSGAPLADGGTIKYGGISITTAFDGGAQILSIAAGGAALETFVYPSGGTEVTGTGDLNQDGQVDWQYSSAYDGVSTVTTTTLADTNFDGVFDDQDVWVVDIGQGPPYQKTETVSRYLGPDGGLATTADGGTWVQLWTHSGLAIADQSSGGGGGAKPRCLAGNGMDGFPDLGSYTGKYKTVPGTLIQIVDDNSYPGACNDLQAGQLVSAFEAALEDIPLCLQSARPELAGEVAVAAESRPLIVGCGNDCSGKAASTDLPFSTGSILSDFANNRVMNSGQQQMNLNPAVVFDGPSVQWREEILLHELIHFTGHDHDPPPVGDPQGHDMVYGCGRYCVQGGLAAAAAGNIGGCQAPNGAATIGWGGGTPSPTQYAYDCADCADDAHRKACGGALADVTDCSPDDCKLPAGDNQGCAQGTTCCAFEWLTCWGNQATGLGSRDPYEVPYTKHDCLQTDCYDSNGKLQAQANPGCDVGNPVYLGADNATVRSDCQSFPIGWCGVN